MNTDAEHSHVVGYDTTDEEFFSDDASDSGNISDDDTDNSTMKCDFEKEDNSTSTSGFSLLY